MNVTEAQIITDVRAAIDENTTAAALSGYDSDTLEMEDIIRSKIVDGINAVRRQCPISFLEPTRVASGEAWPIRWIDTEKCIGELLLPDDYLRLILFKMSDWSHGVSQHITPDDALYGQQFSRWQGVRGNATNPVVAISVSDETGRGVIQFFSSTSTGASAVMVYVQRCEANGDGTYAIEKRVYRAAVLKIAALVAATYQSVDLMNLMNTLVGEEINS